MINQSRIDECSIIHSPTLREAISLFNELMISLSYSVQYTNTMQKNSILILCLFVIVIMDFK